MSGTDPDPERNRAFDGTQPYRPADAPEPAPPIDPNLPKIPGITLQAEIARGGMGVVYAGRQDFLDRRVAVKLLSVELGGESFVQRFQREAKILAGIKHPNIVACHMAGQTPEGQSYLVMEFIDGPSLKGWIADHGVVPVRAALRTTRAIAAALAHAHLLGIIHRDVKPENVLLETVTSTALDVTFPFTPKVVDLGLARASSGNAALGLTSPGSVMGTPATMSPEQYDEPDEVDFRTDIYGLGCTLYEMLVGKPAFRGKKLSEIVTQKRQPVPPDPCRENADVPAAVGALVQQMLATNRTDRQRSYKELDEQLSALIDSMTGAAARAQATRFVGEETELTTFRRPSQPPGTTPPKGTTPPPPAGTSGPGLLKTAELNFLSEGMAAPGAGQDAASPFLTRPPAGAKPPAQDGPSGPGLLKTAELNFLSEGMAPTAGAQPSDEAFRTRVVPGAAATTVPGPGGAAATAAPPAKRRTGVMAAAVLGAAVLAGAGYALTRPGDEGTPPLPQPDGPKPQPKAANAPPVVKLQGPEEVPFNKPFTIQAEATDDEPGDLKYQWDLPLEIRLLAGRDAAKATFLVEDGLPGVELGIGLSVRDKRGAEAQITRKVRVGEMPFRPAMEGFKGAGSGWRLDKNDPNWVSTVDGSSLAICNAWGERRTMETDLGGDAYWEWEGLLTAASLDDKAVADITLRFEFGDKAWCVTCTRGSADDDAPWLMASVPATLTNGSWTNGPLLDTWTWDTAVPKDDVDKVATYYGWFRVQRHADKLHLTIGSAMLEPKPENIPGRGMEKIAPREPRVVSLDGVSGDPKLTVVVNRGRAVMDIKRR